MANRHYDINEEFQIDLTLKITVKRCSDFRYLKESEIEKSVIDFKNKITEHLKEKITSEYYREEVTDSMDDWTYNVE